MATKITGYQNPPTQVGADKSVTRTGGTAAVANSGGTADTVASKDPVKITDQARQLASLEQTIQSLPVVDEARVNEIRSALEQGRYEVSPERIADKLLRTEQELSA